MSNETIYLHHIDELVVIGEASGYMSEEIKEKYPHIAWRDIKDMRNFVIHEYFDVSAGIIWQTIQKDLPELQQVVQDELHIHQS